jgi:hypothetical protein
VLLAFHDREQRLAERVSIHARDRTVTIEADASFRPTAPSSIGMRSRDARSERTRRPRSR